MAGYSAGFDRVSPGRSTSNRCAYPALSQSSVTSAPTRVPAGKLRPWLTSGSSSVEAPDRRSIR